MWCNANISNFKLNSCDAFSNFFFNIIILQLLLFAPTGESATHMDGKTAIATTSSSSSSSVGVPTENKTLVRECFTDFLVLKFGERTKMCEKRNRTFVVDIYLVDQTLLREFIERNEDGKASELMNCIDKAWPNKNKALTDPMDIFRMILNEVGSIAPSQHVQDKLYNAQCLLDLGVIEGKVMMKKLRHSENYEPMEESEWFQELREFGKQQQHIVIGQQGVDYLKMRKCLRKKGKPFVASGPGPNEHLLLLDDIDREELVKMITKPLVPFSDWLLKQIAPNQMQKECFADVCLSYFKFKSVAVMRGKQFVVRISIPDYFPIFGLINSNTEELQQFMNCLRKASTLPNHLHISRNLENLVHELFWSPRIYNQAIALPHHIQQKIENAQCWLDLGVIEGKILMKRPGKYYKPAEESEWFQELKEADKHHQHIVISAEGADHMRKCLRKGKPFDVKMEANGPKSKKQHLLQLNSIDREELVKIILKQVPFSKWLLRKITKEHRCVGDWLVRHCWHVKTRLHRYYKDIKGKYNIEWIYKESRRIVWSENEQQLNSWPTKVHSKDKEFWTLKKCLFRKAAFLRSEIQPTKQYTIDLDRFFRLVDGRISISPLLTRELNTQSDCLAKFLAIKSGDGGKCLLKKRESQDGALLEDIGTNDPTHAYIINDGDKEREYTLSAKNCHLPEGETGTYEEGSEEFKQLWDCGVRMTTEQGGKNAIDVRNLLKIHTSQQLFLRGIPVEIFPTIESKPGEKCPLCQGEYEKNERERIIPCKHTFHDKCLQPRIEKQDGCPLCNAEILKYLPVDSIEMFSSADEESDSDSDSDHDNDDIGDIPGATKMPMLQYPVIDDEDEDDDIIDEEEDDEHWSFEQQEQPYETAEMDMELNR